MEKRGTVLEAARCRYLWSIFTLPSPNGEQDTEALGLAVCVESVSDSGPALIVTWSQVHPRSAAVPHAARQVVPARF